LLVNLRALPTSSVRGITRNSAAVTGSYTPPSAFLAET
jgi:hypothetical protein